MRNRDYISQVVRDSNSEFDAAINTAAGVLLGICAVLAAVIIWLAAHHG